MGVFPHLFSCWKQVFPRSVLCPPRRYSIRKSGSWGGNWRQPGQRAALRRPGEQVPGLPRAPRPYPAPEPWGPSQGLALSVLLACLLNCVVCSLHPHGGSGYLPWLRVPQEKLKERAPHPRHSFAAPPAGEPVSRGELEFSLQERIKPTQLNSVSAI